jgi:hypothetical protein
VRLDGGAEQALRAREASGWTQSEAVRAALIGEARRRRWLVERAAEVAVLEADPSDRDRMLAVDELVESLRAPS